MIFTCTHLIFACTMVKIGKILQNFTWKTLTSPKIWHERVSFYNRNSKILQERGFNLLSFYMKRLPDPSIMKPPLVHFGKAAGMTCALSVVIAYIHFLHLARRFILLYEAFFSLSGAFLLPSQEKRHRSQNCST